MNVPMYIFTTMGLIRQFSNYTTNDITYIMYNIYNKYIRAYRWTTDFAVRRGSTNAPSLSYPYIYIFKTMFL